MALLKKEKRDVRHDQNEHRTPPPEPKRGPKEEPWTRDVFYRDLHRVTSKIEDLIRKDPEEVSRLKRRLRRAQEGEGPWGVEDDENPHGDTE